MTVEKRKSCNICDTTTVALRWCGKSIKFITVEPVITLEAGSRADGLGAAAFTQPSRTALSANRNGNKYRHPASSTLLLFSKKHRNKKQQTIDRDRKLPKRRQSRKQTHTSSWQGCRKHRQQTSQLKHCQKTTPTAHNYIYGCAALS